MQALLGFVGRGRRLATLGLAVFVVTAVAAAPASARGSSRLTTAKPLSSALRADGTLRHRNGSFSARGYRLVLGRNGAPRFVRAKESAAAVARAKALAHGSSLTRSLSAGPTLAQATFSATNAADVHWSDRFGMVGVPDASTVNAVAISGSKVYVAGEFSSVSSDSALAYNSVAVWNGTGWYALGTGMLDSYGNAATVNALAVSGGVVYAGGNFVSAGGHAAASLAKWNGSAWSAIPGGLGNTDGSVPTVNALALSGTNLYVGGVFDKAGGKVAHSIARWTTTATTSTGWSALGTGMIDCYYWSAGTCQGDNGSASVNALQVSGSSLYAGGGFTDVAGRPIYGLARWTGTAWTTVTGGGVSNSSSGGVVNAITVDPKTGTLYVGGEFDHVGVRVNSTDGSTSGGVAANDVTQLSGGAWHALSSGARTCYSGGSCYLAPVNALLFTGGKLYMGGSFNTAGPSSIPTLAVWSGTSWATVGRLGAVDGAQVNAMGVSPFGVYAVGTFTTAGNPATTWLNQIGFWNGARWTGLGQGVGFANTGLGSLSAVAASNHTLYAAGDIYNEGSISTPALAKFDGTTWSKLGTGFDSNSSAYIHAIVINGPDVFVAGNFSSVGGVSASNIAMWDGSKWNALGTGTDDTVDALLIYNGKLWAGGSFQSPGQEVATWDLTKHVWSAVGGNPSYDNGSVNALAGITQSPYNHYVLIGGGFWDIYYVVGQTKYYYTTNGLTLFDTNTKTIANPLSGYSPVGGTGTSAGVTNPCQYPPCSGTINALYQDGLKLYMGGDFADGGGKPSRGFAAYDFTGAGKWVYPGQVGGGTGGSSGIVNAITKVNGILYVAGNFTTAGGVTSPGVASYTTASGTWGGLGSGLAGDCLLDLEGSALAQSADGLYVAGCFGAVGGHPSQNLALWTSTAFPLKATETVSPASVVHGSPATFTVSLKNASVGTATGVTLKDKVPANMTVGAITTSQGTCANSAGTITCSLGTLGANATATVKVTLTPTVAGAYTNAVTATETGSSNTAQASVQLAAT
jgi:uncharacterized repeat protein (TIGR01451 family)